jgi:hypothetical protein
MSYKSTYTVITQTTQTKISDATLAADPKLQFPVKNGGYYKYQLAFSVYAEGAGEVKYDLNMSGASNGQGWNRETNTAGGRVSTGGFGALGSTSLSCNGAVTTVIIEGWLNPTADGTFSFRWAQNSSNATNSHLLAGTLSYLKMA